MKKILLFILLSLASYSPSAYSQDSLKDITDLIKNLTDALNRIDQDGRNISHIAVEYLELFNANMPKILTYLASISELPLAITKMVDVVNQNMPLAETCIYALGGCMVFGSLIFLSANIINYCSHRLKAKEINTIF